MLNSHFFSYKVKPTIKRPPYWFHFSIRKETYRSISPKFLGTVLQVQIPKAQKESQVISVFLLFCVLHLQKLLVKCWWNLPLDPGKPVHNWHGFRVFVSRDLQTIVTPCNRTTMLLSTPTKNYIFLIFSTRSMLNIIFIVNTRYKAKQRSKTWSS